MVAVFVMFAVAAMVAVVVMASCFNGCIVALVVALDEIVKMAVPLLTWTNLLGSNPASC